MSGPTMVCKSPGPEYARAQMSASLRTPELVVVPTLMFSGFIASLSPEDLLYRFSIVRLDSWLLTSVAVLALNRYVDDFGICLAKHTYSRDGPCRGF